VDVDVHDAVQLDQEGHGRVLEVGDLKRDREKESSERGA
jgi:hypothetical protein